MPTRRPVWLLALLLLLFVPAMSSALVELYTDWLWFREVGFEPVFLRSLGAGGYLALRPPQHVPTPTPRVAPGIGGNRQ